MLAMLSLSSFILAIPVVSAGYGDQAPDGLPSWQERELHLFTNAVRVDPEAFESEYINGGCSLDDFSTIERTPAPPLHMEHGLQDAARYHSEDMNASDCFQHESCDGTSMVDRLSRFYSSGLVGENIAFSTYGTMHLLASGWMCSPGHRENIMWPDWTELGTGISSIYYTQDFGGGEVAVDSAVRMGLHTPEVPEEELRLLADWEHVDAPPFIQGVINGVSVDLELLYGSEEMGVYFTDVTTPLDTCSEYYFQWLTSDGTYGTFPEDGSYQFGTDCESEWVDWQAEPSGHGPDAVKDSLADGEPSSEDSKLLGCSTTDLNAAYTFNGMGNWLIPLVLMIFTIPRRRWDN